jgi:hypothetical protein
VGIAVERPGKAASAAGISSIFLNENMSASPAWRRKYSPWAAATHRAGQSRLCAAQNVSGALARDPTAHWRLPPMAFAAYCAGRAPPISGLPEIGT